MKYRFVIILLFANHFLLAQISSSISTNADSIQIGESLKLFVKVETGQASNIEYLDFSSYDTLSSVLDRMVYDSLDFDAEIDWDFDFKNDQKRISPKAEDYTNNAYLDTFELTFWDVGIFYLPAPIIKTTNGTYVVYGQDVTVAITPPRNIVNTDTTTIILPIKDIIQENNTLENYLWIIYLLFAILLTFLLYNALSKPIEQVEIEAVERVELPAHIIAEKELDKLRTERLWEKDLVKEHQSRLTFIIRKYLENRFGIKALESTTMQIQNQLNAIAVSSEQQNNLREILQIADLVKFAKAIPPFDINETFIDKAEKFISDSKENMSKESTAEITQQRQSYLNYLNHKARLNQLSQEEHQYINSLSDEEQAQFEFSTQESNKTAPLTKRLMATLIDYVALSLFTGGLSYLIANLTQDSSKILNLYPIMVILFLGLLAAMESRIGQSIGKKILSVQIKQNNLDHIPISKTLLRNIIKLICISLIFPMLTVILSAERRAPYDLLLGIDVINKNRYHG